MTPPPKLSYPAAWAVVAPDVSGIVTEDDTPVDNIHSEKHRRILTEPLYSSWAGPPPDEDGPARTFAVFSNVGLFPNPTDAPLVPDVMLSLDVTVADDLSVKENRSYFVWCFGKAPEVVIEIVSNREGGELDERLRRYRRMRVSYYVVYDAMHELSEHALHTFELRGDRYVKIERPWFENIGLGLVEWEGEFEGAHGLWLRWCARDGSVIPTGAERARAAEAKAQTAEAKAQTAEARAQRLAAKLRELGIDPNGDAE